MAEFVERALEQLLPAFEQLKLVQLFSAEELDEFIKNCRAFEYKCSKQTKQGKDFLAYAAFIEEQLGLIQRRRKEMKYAHRYDDIERPLKNKCAFLYRICTQRFKSLEYHERELAFLHRAQMWRHCSQAYTRLLHFYGHLPENYVKACRFEFFDNSSAESARAIVLLGLRKFPQYIPLWTAHFELELRYVSLLLRRRNFLSSTKAILHESMDPMDVDWAQKRKFERQKPKQIAKADAADDELMQLKLARVVYEMAMKSIEEPAQKRKLLHQFLQIAKECGEFTKDLAQNLEEHLRVLNDAAVADEEKNIAQIPDEQLFEIDTEGIDDSQNNKTTNTSQQQAVAGGTGKVDVDGKRKKSSRSVLDGFDPNDPELKKLLSKAVVTDDFDQKPLYEVLISSQRQRKKANKLERAKTAGQRWFGMPATEMDEERRRDLELMQMRDALDPKQHYKRPDREVLPKYFQVGRIIESKADFYSERLTRKQRKRTIAEELMADYETIARNKKRYTEILRKREMLTKARGRGTFQRKSGLSKRSKRKNKTRSH